MSGKQPQLVFGDDGSAAADVAWLWVLNHTWPGWRVSVVTAKHDPEAGKGPDSGLRPWEPEVPRRMFDSSPEVVLEHLAAAADPREVLASFPDANLIAIGPRGSGALKAMHVGSTAESLLSSEQPLAPLAIIRSARPTRDVVLCVDGSPHAQRAAEVLAGMPWVSGCTVRILGVADGSADPTAGMAAAAEVVSRSGAAVDEVEAVAMRRMLAMDVKSTILDYVADTEPDLVAMGTRGEGGLKRLLLGSTASAVAHYARCSVLITRLPSDQA